MYVSQPLQCSLVVLSVSLTVSQSVLCLISLVRILLDKRSKNYRRFYYYNPTPFRPC